ncbi:hypothetical protein D3C78_1592310 [compost metagenome]
MGEDDDGKVEVGAGEQQVLLAFRGGHDPGQQIQVAVACLLQHFAPAAGFDRGELHVQALADQFDVVGGQALMVALRITELEGWPGGVHTQAQLAVIVEPGLFFRGERDGAGREGPEGQREHQ